MKDISLTSDNQNKTALRNQTPYPLFPHILTDYAYEVGNAEITQMLTEIINGVYG